MCIEDELHLHKLHPELQFSHDNDCIAPIHIVIMQILHYCLCFFVSIEVFFIFFTSPPKIVLFVFCEMEIQLIEICKIIVLKYYFNKTRA